MVLKAVNLQKTYPGGVEAVKGIDITVEEGEIYGFLGPNGAGKSTSIKMFSGLLRPTGGNLEIFGIDVSTDFQKIKDQIGYVPQNLIYYDHLTVLENLQLFAACYEIERPEERISELLDLLQISEIKNRKSSDLSGGQKRGVNLAMGVLNDPKLLFLDEPSAGMDPQSRRVLWDSIRRLVDTKDMSIILTTHLMETADKLSDRIAIIDHGEIKIVDTPKNLKEKFGTGEIIQVQLDEEVNGRFEEILKQLSLQYEDVNVRKSTFRIGSEDAIDDLSGVLEIIKSFVSKEEIKQISINETTLEDVFIKITGSELRE